ncbi:hypothetical protein BVG16_15635 [Paenibacillus selenitireducens]|uniref:Major tropism determinant N-terminal domain-containing protein n=1 Tax=Paenibacillus selenitireducens TaxID=1324314 RepID=A0A1T2X9X2_9BACL|nr:DUF2793 domain-containing protein [Paenibacillus selenitireducens]OPA76612.1 hypothetical protein BVG16_15635 [Paenibacillus selenitireducens]
MAQQTIRVRRGTKAELVALGALLSGEMGFCTDTKEVFIGDGTVNNFVGRAMSGTEAARPAAANLGRFYYVTSGTNSGYLYFDTGTAWQRVNAQKLSELTGTLDDISDGATYAKVKKADITNGQVNKVSDGTNTKTAAEIKTHIDDATLHRKINDSSTGIIDLWSAQKINTEISNAIRGLSWQDSVGSRVITIPPGSPTLNNRYIIPANATGVWAGKTNQIAHWNGTSWIYYTPTISWAVYVHDENKNYTYNGTSWARSGEANQNIIAGDGLGGGGQADTVTLSVGAGNGITVGTTTVSVKGAKGITVDASGVSANIDNSSIVNDAANGNRLMVAVIDGGTF